MLADADKELQSEAGTLMPLKYKPIIPKRTGLRKLMKLYAQFESLMGNFVTEAHDELASYPPRKVGGRYKRTGMLGRSWQHRVEAKRGAIVGTVASAGQIAPYNVYVQGPRQVKWAKGYGWKQPKDVIKRRWPKMQRAVRAAIKAAAR